MRERFRIRSGVSEDVGLALGVAGAVALISGALLYGVVAELRGWALALLIVGVVSLIVASYLARTQVARVIATRQGRYGLNTLVMIAAFTVILILANVVSSGVNARVDVTATGSFTLASQTQQILANLDEPVAAYGFFTPDDQAAAVADGLLREYALRSGNFDYEIVDPETDPAQASRYQVDQNGVVVFASEDRVARTLDLNEQAFTSALLQATGEGLKTVCFTSGHGERSVLGTTNLGMNRAGQALERELYIVRDFGFSSAGQVPDDCSVVIVAGPDRDLVTNDTINEGALLRAYLGGGGNVLFLIAPTTPDSWKLILFEAGIGAGGGVVVDPASYAQPDLTTPTIRPEGYFPGHPVTDPLIERSLVTFFPLVTRVAPLPVDQQFRGAQIYPLIFTTDRSWLETDMDNLERATYNQASDLRGPIAVAVGTEFPTTTDPGRIVAIGNAAFAGNQFLTSAGNLDLFLNSVSWLTEQEDLIGIRARLDAPRLLILSQREANWILYSGVGVFPALMILLAGWVWWRRR